MTVRRLLVAFTALSLVLVLYSASASAQQNSSQTSGAATAAAIANETPIPVEADGGIGDGAGPIPQQTDEGGLAKTGSDSLAIAFLGAGMIIVGATAVATAQSWRTR